LVGNALGWGVSSQGPTFPAIVLSPYPNDFLILPRLKLVCVPDGAYQLRFGGVGYDKVCVDFEYEAVYAPPGWTMLIGNGLYVVGSPGHETNAVVLSGRQQRVMLPASGWWSAV
jgi:hypothetical protein